KSTVEESQRHAQKRNERIAARQAKVARQVAERREWEKRQAPGLAHDGQIMQPVSIATRGSSVGTPSPVPPLDQQQQFAGQGGGSRTASPGPGSRTSVAPASIAPRQAPPRIGTGMDYLEFEQGLPPPDPWRTHDDDDDLRALREVMGGAPAESSASSSPTKSTATSPTHHNVHDHPPSSSTSTSPTRAAVSNVASYVSNLAQRPTAVAKEVAGHAEDVVARARALVATFHHHGAPTGGPPMPPKPAAAVVSAPVASVAPAQAVNKTAKRASMQYPVLPGISDGPPQRRSSIQHADDGVGASTRVKCNLR
ncbi:hypothetical protein HKX48_002716, partial [Thoreauomyces humboldtii]